MRNPLHDITPRISARIHSLSAEEREAGMVPTEYALATAMGAGCVGVVYKIATSDQFLELVKKFILQAFHL